MVGVPEGGKDAFDSVDVQLIRTDHEDPERNELAVAQLRITVKDADERKVGRAFTTRITEMALANYPGLLRRRRSDGASTYGVYWPALIPADACHVEVIMGDRRRPVATTNSPATPTAEIELPCANDAAVAFGPVIAAPLGRIVGARSGDKGGDANVGVWARSRQGYLWLREYLTVERLAELFPEARSCSVERHELPNLLAVNFILHGLLEEGVASSTRLDAQAKGFGEYLRSRVVPIPEVLLAEATP